MIEIKVEEEGIKTVTTINVQVKDAKTLAMQLIALQVKVREALKKMVPEDEFDLWTLILADAMRYGLVSDEEVEG